MSKNKKPSFINEQTKTDQINQAKKFVNGEFGPRKRIKHNPALKASNQSKVMDIAKKEGLEQEFLADNN